MKFDKNSEEFLKFSQMSFKVRQVVNIKTGQRPFSPQKMKEKLLFTDPLQVRSSAKLTRPDAARPARTITVFWLAQSAASLKRKETKRVVMFLWRNEAATLPDL